MTSSTARERYDQYQRELNEAVRAVAGNYGLKHHTNDLRNVCSAMLSLGMTHLSGLLTTSERQEHKPDEMIRMLGEAFNHYAAHAHKCCGDSEIAEIIREENARRQHESINALIREIIGPIPTESDAPFNGRFYNNN
jgi:hypothetical protein